MLEIQHIAEKLDTIEANLVQVAETLSMLGEASARGLEHAARTLEAVAQQLERKHAPIDGR